MIVSQTAFLSSRHPFWVTYYLQILTKVQNPYQENEMYTDGWLFACRLRATFVTVSGSFPLLSNLRSAIAKLCDTQARLKAPQVPRESHYRVILFTLIFIFRWITLIHFISRLINCMSNICRKTSSTPLKIIWLLWKQDNIWIISNDLYSFMISL